MAVKYFAWGDAKSAKLKADRGIGFEDTASGASPSPRLRHRASLNFVAMKGEGCELNTQRR
jgi:hypothetical protein